MRAMVLTEIKKPLELQELPLPQIKPYEVLIRISACGICRTDLHVKDGELPNAKLPLVLGHQIVGYIEDMGSEVNGFKIGDRVGVPWLSGSCGSCGFCKHGKENLCDQAIYTGYQINGGFAEYTAIDFRFVFPLPSSYSDVQVAPLLCAGLIGYRAYRMTKGANKIGFYGFGSSAHILTQIVNHKNGEIYAFTKSGDIKGQEFAKEVGAVWAGDAQEMPPSLLDAAIIFAPVGSLVIAALKAIRKGGVVVCAGIYMSDIPSFPYKLLWEERILRSVSNLTRKDGEEFFEIASHVAIHTTVSSYSLEDTDKALEDLRTGKVKGSLVIKV